MSDIVLSSAVRSSLLSLSETTELIDQTNLRLATGLEVSSPIDDPVAFFAAEALSDTAEEFTAAAEEIEQGVSAITAALDGIEGIDSLVRQLSGLTSSLASAEGSQFIELADQFNVIAGQIGELANDTDFAGLNLIDNTGESLTVSFSSSSSSFITIDAVDLTEEGLGIDELFTTADLAAGAAAGGFLTGTDSAVTFDAAEDLTLSIGDTAAGATGFTSTITVTFNGTGTTVIEANDTTSTDPTGTEITFSFGTASIAITGNTSADVTVTSGQVLTLAVASAADSSVVDTVLADDALFGVISDTVLVTTAGGAAPTDVTISVDAFTLDDVAATGDFSADGFDFVQVGNTDLLNAVEADLDSALDTLAGEAATLGSNVALLQTRLDFSENFATTLETAAADLTLADLTTEGANLLALQTRQSLGISALAFAGQSEQSVLSIFS